MFRKQNKLITMFISSLAMICMDAAANCLVNQDPFLMCGHIYLGGFVGGGNSTDNTITQKGVALFDASSGGPLEVDASGYAQSYSVDIAGLHLGYEWCSRYSSCWSLIPAFEIEAYYLRGTQRTDDLNNPTARLPEHNFHDVLPMHTGVYLANLVFSLRSPCACRFQPYIGGGLGTANVSISDATSTQIDPEEPDVNHFNSGTHYRDNVFAAQGKIGLRFCLSNHWRIFGEYRILHLNSNDFIFGSTKYPTHAPTTDWIVKRDSTNYNMGVVGVDFIL